MDTPGTNVHPLVAAKRPRASFQQHHTPPKHAITRVRGSTTTRDRSFPLTIRNQTRLPPHPLPCPLQDFPAECLLSLCNTQASKPSVPQPAAAWSGVHLLLLSKRPRRSAASRGRGSRNSLHLPRVYRVHAWLVIPLHQEALPGHHVRLGVFGLHAYERALVDAWGLS